MAQKPAHKEAPNENARPDELSTAIAAVEDAPSDLGAWDRLDEALERVQRPEDAAACYLAALRADTPRELLHEIGQRGVRFFETWFGEGSSELPSFLERVLKLDPRAHWAFERLTVAHTVGGRFADLLSAYDRAIESADETARRMKLLEEAAQVAKDFAHAPDRAIGYLSQLHVLEPDNSMVVAALERLLERQERFADLATLWTARLGVQPDKQARESRVRIATLQIERLEQHAAALEQIKHVLASAPGHAGAYSLLERIVGAEAAQSSARKEALAITRKHLLEEHKAQELVRVLELSLLGADVVDQRALLRELVERFVELGEDERALRHQAKLVVLDPLPKERETLAALAARTREPAILVDALSAAADASGDPTTAAELRLRAGHASEELLNDAPRAIGLLDDVFDRGPSQAIVLQAGRRLLPLLERTDRAERTLEVLGKLSELEGDEAHKRVLLGKVARLAEKVGDRGRAELAWRARIAVDADDLEALEALIRSAEVAGDYARLCELLETRVKAKGASEQRRADLVRLARVYDTQLTDLSAAIATWRRVEQQLGEDAESLAALTDLLSRAERWQELADTLSQAADRQIARFTELQARLGDAYRERLDHPELAAERYRSALQASPRDPAALAGQRALLEDARSRSVAVVSLNDAYASSDAWRETLALLEPRLAVAPAPQSKAAILVESAVLYEQRANDPREALACYARAFALTPDDRNVEREIRRLAEQLGAWTAVVQAYRDTIASLPRETPRMAELRHDEGRILELRLHDMPAALDAYCAATAIAPGREDLAASAVRAAAALGKLEEAAAQAVACMIARGELLVSLLTALETAAEVQNTVAALCQTLTEAAQQAAVQPTLSRALHVRVSMLQLDSLSDEAEAEAALVRAVHVDSSDIDTLVALADLQRKRGEIGLCETLVLLGKLRPDDLDPWHEAAEIAAKVRTTEGAARNELSSSRAIAIFEQLYDRASAMLRRAQKAAGKVTAEHAVRAALDALTEALGSIGEHERVLGLFLASSTLPVAEAFKRDDLRRAAAIAHGVLGDEARAIALYHDLVQLDPRDKQARSVLATLYEAKDRLPDLLALRRDELKLAEDEPTRIELRLEIARKLSELETRGGQQELLMQNLRAQPGHGPTLDALTTLLDARGRHAQLAELLCSQARLLVKHGQPARAVELLDLAATRYERELRDVEAAIEVLRELHELAPEGDASAALARLYTARGEHAAAAKWLEVRLGTVPPDTRSVTAVELGRAHLDAGQRDRARGALERALREDPAIAGAREMLAHIYREDRAHEPLAGLLSEWSVRETEPTRRLALLREAASLYYDTLGAPERAVDVLSRAAQLAPDDRELGLRLADGLQRAGRSAEARGVLERLIELYGRKRSPERAELHFQLARVLESIGEAAGALEQLDIATKMDVAHLEATRMLARLWEQQGDFDRAERVYRGLLMLVRRQSADTVSKVGSAEVFYELATIAKRRDQLESANELLQSALEAATQNDVEAERLQALLTARSERALLMRLLDARLKLAGTPAAQHAIQRAKAQALAATGDSTGALEAALKALVLAPDDLAVHTEARAYAKAANATDRYLEQVSTLADDLGRRREPEAKKLAARLTLILGEAIEQDLGQLDRAAGLYAKVEASGEHTVQAWLAMARVSGARGDGAEQRRVLERIVELPPEQLGEDGRREAMLALAEVELKTPAYVAAGLATLERALRGMTDYERVKQVMRAAAAAPVVEASVAAAFERVARVSRDESMLLEHFERLAAAPSGTLPALREGVELALRGGKHLRAEALLKRALELAITDGGKPPSWVLTDLSDCRLGQGDAKGAMGYLHRALDVAEAAELDEIGRDLARLASGPEGDLEVAVIAYERLAEKNPNDRTLWQPMLELGAKLNDRARFEALAATCIERLSAPNERVAVRMMLAMFLIETAGDARAATPALRGVLDEDPSRSDARELLASIYDQQGMQEELAELLQSQFDSARDARNFEAIADIGLRIGNLFGARRPEASIDAYRAALEWVPAHTGLLHALLERMGSQVEPRERAEVLQQLLAAESGEAAAKLALQLYTTWKSLDELESAQAALELGLEKHPEHERVRELLEGCYAEREDWRKLAELFEREAARLGHGAAAVVRLKNAATFYREQLQDLPAAASALRKALEITPDDLSLAGELARNLAAAGQHDAAIQDLTHLLDGHPKPDTTRVDLLRVRAELFLDTERLELGVADLEEAHGIAAPEVRPRLIEALERRKSAAFTVGDTASERVTALRLVDLHDAAGHEENAREVLAEWVEQDPHDVPALSALRIRDEQTGRNAEVILTCERLIDAASGETRIEAALALVHAAIAIGQPDAARSGLERVHRDHPAHAGLRTSLRELYEALGERTSLAAILLADAAHTDERSERVALYQRAAQLYLELGDTASALPALEEACRLEPDDFTTQLLMIDTNIQLGRSDEANAALEVAIAVHRKRRTPELAVLFQRKGRLAGAQGDAIEHIKWLNQAMEADRKSGELASELAEVSMAAADYDTAMKALRMLTMMDDPHPMSRAIAFLRQAQIAHLRGDPRRAQQWARKAKSLDDGLGEADQFLAEIGG